MSAKKAYVCIRCGTSFIEKKKLASHEKDCSECFAARLDTYDKELYGLLQTLATYGRDLAFLKEKILGTPADKLPPPPPDAEGIKFDVQEGKLYRQSPASGEFELVEPVDLFGCLCNHDFSLFRRDARK